MPTEVAKNVYWVGHVDWDIRDFHGYHTDRGSSYNAYLVVEEKAVLVDTVKAPFAADLIASVKSILGARQLDFVICNHAEPDHSGSLDPILKEFHNAELVCNEKCRKALELHYDTEGWKFKIISDGDELDLGSRKLSFIETPMVHWPESMFTFMQPDGILFSMDAFGQHYASEGRFDESEDLGVLLEEAKTYYANIVMLYGKPIAKVLDKASGLDIKLIAPSHGIMWKKHIDTIVNAYLDWVVCRPVAKVVVLYDTMWGSTKKMAQAIAEGVKEGGAQVRVLNVREDHITEVATEALDAAVLACGSATLNMSLMPQMAAALTYLRGLKPVGKMGRAFGSYGWGKGGPEEVHKYLEDMKCNMLGEPIRSQFVPREEMLEECRSAGREMAAKALSLAEVSAND